MLLGDTIAAVATASGRGGVAVVRVSGPDAFAVARRLTGREPEPGRIAFVHTPVDDCVLLTFRGPRSYTGEDVVEFQCHGGAVTPKRMLEACFSAGARLARRGEFTQRAFLNGKLDYDQAESVLDLIDAKTSRAADAALEGLAGRKRRECRDLYDEALSISTDLEHALDIDEGELPPDFVPAAMARIVALKNRVASVIRRAREGRILREGALVVLAGPPNSGKSSLMNALLQENRAIVSDVPGTTRDSIEEWLDISGWPVRLVDTAGLRQTGDAIEAEGVRRAEDLIARADVVVGLGGLEGLESSINLPNPPTFAKPLPNLCQTSQTFCSRLIRVHAKCDLGRGEGLNVSAKTGEGLDALKCAIAAKLEASFADGKADDGGGTPDESRLSSLMEAEAILAAKAPCAVDETGREEPDLVLLGNRVRAVAERLGSLVGATYSDDLLENLFSRFCVGK